MKYLTILLLLLLLFGCSNHQDPIYNYAVTIGQENDSLVIENIFLGYVNKLLKSENDSLKRLLDSLNIKEFIKEDSFDVPLTLNKYYPE